MEIKKETAHYFHVQFLAVVENQFVGLLRSRMALSNVCIRFYQLHSLICLVTFTLPAKMPIGKFQA